jgi:hypothetical protein
MYRPSFSGHETFPLRQGWLKKVYDAVSTHKGAAYETNPFDPESAIARYGVGKNMVMAMRHWALTTGIICENIPDAPLMYSVTPVGMQLLSHSGDPYLEDPASTWLLHWNLAGGEGGRQIKTSLYWLFSLWNGGAFTKDDLIEALLKLATDQQWRRVSKTTVQRDVDCLLRCYTVSEETSNTPEEAVESQLAELRLVTNSQGRYQLTTSQRRTLPDSIFLYALVSYWKRQGTSRSLTIDSVVYAPSSPGRVFVMREDEVLERLQRLESLTGNSISLSETAGLKQVVRSSEFPDTTALVRNYYGRTQ